MKRSQVLNIFYVILTLLPIILVFVILTNFKSSADQDQVNDKEYNIFEIKVIKNESTNSKYIYIKIGDNNFIKLDDLLSDK